MWTKSGLQDLIKERLAGRQFIVVANREPYVHQFKGGRIECQAPASGMVSALDPILRASGGTWIAHGSGTADRKAADTGGYVDVPPDNPHYTLRRLWLTKTQVVEYYHGLANEGIWPLCHMVFTRPTFYPPHWQTYRQVNELFGQAVLEEAGDEPALVFFQDYHFGLAPRFVKERNPTLITAHFWHIPWPAPPGVSNFPLEGRTLGRLIGQ